MYIKIYIATESHRKAPRQAGMRADTSENGLLVQPDCSLDFCVKIPSMGEPFKKRFNLVVIVIV